MLGSSLRTLQLGLGMDGPCRSTKQRGLSDFVSHTMLFLVSLQVHIVRDRSGQLLVFMRYSVVCFLTLSGVLFPCEPHGVVDFVPHTWLLLLRAVAQNISTKAERGTSYCFFLLRLRYYHRGFLCVYSISVAAVEKGYACLFFGRGAATAGAGACAAYNISTEAERGTGYGFFPLRFCPLHRDA